ncbi:YHYH protein [uncultured Shewanella sp.]|uniref:YHYH protein n=1 Tax=uncultured Shewanella sp. TaxID=173975 RepID=UPI00260485CA|nr:YHYH protein [uncultured Shewanella sp.]
MKKNKLTLLLIPLLSLSLSACNSDDTSTQTESSTSNSSSNESSSSSLSLAVDNDQTVSADDEVTLTASITTDSDELSIEWTQTAGTSVSLTQVDSGNTSSISFTAPTLDEESTLSFQITVSDDTSSVSDTINVTVQASETNDDSTSSSNWIINNDTTSTYIYQSDGTSIYEDVQSAETVTLTENNQDVSYTYVEASGIPKYDITMTQDIIDELNSRPKADSDFFNGATTAEVGELILFGQDIGYNSSNENCDTTGGAGYWPPGPGCPTIQEKQAYFPNDPTETDTTCATGLGMVGLMVNGTSIYNWGDGQTEGDGIWYNLAPIAEQYDVDICGGHAANGDYHHHAYTSCLADLVGDDGSGHSPIYGYAADGYPVYGPYESADTLAISGWVTRDYGADTSEGGCGTEGLRTCILVDEYDISQGVEQVEPGPAIGETVTSLSGNTFEADSGYFYEDYYYAGNTVTGPQLDEHNGHDTGDGKGYHYHLTLTKDDDGTLSVAFPFTIGPNFKGELADNSIATCDTDGLPPMEGGDGDRPQMEGM